MTYDHSSAPVLDRPTPSHPADVASEPAADAPRGLDPPARATTKSAKILIVDDEPINIKVVQKYLQGYGYANFRTTTDSTTAMQLGAR